MSTEGMAVLPMSAVSFAVGLVWVAGAGRKRQVLPLVLSAPLVAALVWWIIHFVWGIQSEYVATGDLGNRFSFGIATAFVWGTVTMIWGIPGALLGGIAGAWIRRKRQPRT